MVDVGSDSSIVAEVSFTAGTADYVLGGAKTSKAAFSEIYADGATIIYTVTDNVRREVCQGTFALSANTLSRDTVLYPISGDKVSWPTTGQREISSLLGTGLSVCTDPATDGQVLVWQEATNQWCADQRIYGRDAESGTGQNGTDVNIIGGDGDLTTGVTLGGDVNITGGAGSNNGGSITLTGGIDSGGVYLIAADSSFSSAAGAVTIASGNNTAPGGDGGSIEILGGSAYDGAGGGVGIGAGGGHGDSGGTLFLGGGAATGPSVGSGGSVIIEAGNGPEGGGSISIIAGVGTDYPYNSAVGDGGSITIAAANSDFGSGGSIILETGNSLAGDLSNSGGAIEIILGRGNPGIGPATGGFISIESPAFSANPPTPPRGGMFYIYFDGMDGGKLKIKGSSGTITTLAVP